MSDTLNTIAIYSVLAPVLAAVFRMSQISRRQVVLIIFCLFALGLQYLNQIAAEQFGSNLPNYHFYILIEFLVFAWAFQQEWKDELAGRFTKWSMVGFVLLAALSAIWYPGIMHLPSLTQTVSHVISIGLAANFLLRALREMKIARIERVYLFWLSTGILIYFTGTLLQSIFSEFLIKSEKIYLAVWASRDIFTILFGVYPLTSRNPFQRFSV